MGGRMLSVTRRMLGDEEGAESDKYESGENDTFGNEEGFHVGILD